MSKMKKEAEKEAVMAEEMPQRTEEEKEAEVSPETEEQAKEKADEDSEMKEDEKEEAKTAGIPEENVAEKDSQDKVSSDTNALKKAEKELAGVKEKMLRLQADFENYKRRSQKEKTDVYTHAMESLMTKLLPVIDNLDRAEAAATDNLDSYREGVQMIFKSLLNVLNTEGLQEIESEGQPFDPNFHHGVAVGEDPELEDQVILEVFQKGYLFKDKVIRPAMVKVNQK